MNLKLSIESYAPMAYKSLQNTMIEDIVKYLEKNFEEYAEQYLSKDFGLFMERVNRKILANSTWDTCPYILSVSEKYLDDEEFFIFKQRMFGDYNNRISSTKEAKDFLFELAANASFLRMKEKLDQRVLSYSNLSPRLLLQRSLVIN